MGSSESESYVTTDGQSASLSWNKAPIWGLRPDFYYCQTVAGFLIWGALSDERTGLPFTISVGPRQRSHSRIPVPWDSRPYFTVSDSRLPFTSPRTTRRVTVEVFYPASTRNMVRTNRLLSFYTTHTTEKTMPPTILRCRGKVFTELLPSNDRRIHRRTRRDTCLAILLFVKYCNEIPVRLGVPYLFGEEVS
jgi:hypothetical protein